MAFHAGLLLIATPLLPSAAQAQAKKQTAEGAQAFLSALFSQAGISRWLVVEGQTRLVNGNPALILLGVDEIAHVDEQGQKNPCVTSITKASYGNPLLENGGVFYDRGGSVLPALPGPYATPLFVHWGKSSISRAVGTTPTGAWHYVNAQFRAPSAPDVPLFLRFSSQDTSFADRIEYAMKFLQASCDISADTGF